MTNAEADRRSQLLSRWQEDEDLGALDDLLRLEVESVKRRLRGTGPAPSAASRDDIAQEAVFKLLRADPPPRFPTPAALRSYLWTSVHNLLIDRAIGSDGRSSGRLSYLPESVPSGTPVGSTLDPSRVAAFSIRRP